MMREDPSAELVVDAIPMALWRRQVEPGELVQHSDRGSQGEFNRSSQHLERGGVGWDAGMGIDANGQGADALAGAAAASA